LATPLRYQPVGGQAHQGESQVEGQGVAGQDQQKIAAHGRQEPKMKAAPAVMGLGQRRGDDAGAQPQ